MNDEQLIEAAKAFLKNPNPSYKIDGIDLKLLKSDIVEYNQQKGALPQEDRIRMATSIQARLKFLGNKISALQENLDKDLEFEDAKSEKTAAYSVVGENGNVYTIEPGEATKKQDKAYVERTEKNAVRLTCPRCGHSGDPSKFEDAYGDATCCCLALLMVLPAILYCFFRQGKKICPKCENVF